MSDSSLIQSYQPPVDQLLTLGECKPSRHSDWIDYIDEVGLTTADVSELIRLMTDPILWESEEIGVAGWSVVHAWRALTQLKAIEVIEPMLSLRDTYEDDDWINIEASKVIGLLGPEALPIVTPYLAEQSCKVWTRIAVAEGIENIAQSYPEHRDECVALLVRQLEAYSDNELELNGMLVAFLVELNVVEAAPLMEQVFASRRIDDMMPGTWANVQIELGLKSESDFDPEDLKPQFFKNIEAARLITNPDTNPELDFLDSDRDDRPFPPAFGKPVLEIPAQPLKPVQGFGQSSANMAKGNKNKKKKKK